MPQPPKPARLLGFLGIAPFFVCAVLVWSGNENFHGAATKGLIGYGAVILSFIGGAHWGFASRILSEGNIAAGRLLILSVVPSLVGWISILIPPAWSFALLALAFASVLMLDKWAVSQQLTPDWWVSLRLPLSLTVAILFSITLAIAFFE